jgi:predicted DNA-binding transcriptional regulator YafY
LLYKSASKDQEERIIVHPYAMVLHRDSIYCVGLHVGRGEVRTFLLDRMRDTQAAVTERFELPRDFNIDDYFQGEFGIWKSAERYKVVIDFDAQATEYIRMRRVHPTQKLAATANGIRLTMTVGNLVQLTSWVLEWGARARVVEPAELAERVRAELEGALKGYKRAKA